MNERTTIFWFVFLAIFFKVERERHVPVVFTFNLGTRCITCNYYLIE